LGEARWWRQWREGLEAAEFALGPVYLGSEHIYDGRPEPDPNRQLPWPSEPQTPSHLQATQRLRPHCTRHVMRHVSVMSSPCIALGKLGEPVRPSGRAVSALPQLVAVCAKNVNVFDIAFLERVFYRLLYCLWRRTQHDEALHKPSQRPFQGLDTCRRPSGPVCTKSCCFQATRAVINTHLIDELRNILTFHTKSHQNMCLSNFGLSSFRS
jgi:hypothetical protein